MGDIKVDGHKGDEGAQWAVRGASWGHAGGARRSACELTSLMGKAPLSFGLCCSGNSGKSSSPIPKSNFV